jgi:hypothetical protein
MISMVLGLGITQLFGGIGNLLQVRQRVKPYDLHSAWLAIVIIGHVHIWWSFYGLRAAVVWTYPIFIYILIGPSALVLASHIIMPGEFYEEVHHGKFDLRQHYDTSNRLFFSVFTFVVGWALFLEPVLGVRRLLVPFRLMQLAALLASASCVISRKPIVQISAALIILSIWAVDLLFIRFKAGEFDFSAR